MKKILLAFDGSEQSYNAARLCWTLAKAGNVKLTAQHVVNTKGLWKFLDFQTPGLTGSGPFLSALEAMSAELPSLGETLAMAYNTESQSGDRNNDCLVDEGDTVAQILKRSFTSDLIVTGYRAPTLHSDIEGGYSAERFDVPSVAEELSMHAQCPLLVIQDAVTPWGRLDLQLNCDQRIEDAAAWAASLAVLLGIKLEMHGYILGDETSGDLPDLSSMVARVRALYPALDVTSHKVRFWAEKESGNLAQVACAKDSLVIVPTIGSGSQRKTMFGGSPDSFLRLCGRSSLLFVPIESVKTSSVSMLAYSGI